MIRKYWNRWLDSLGLRVASLDAMPQLAMLAIPVGLISGGVVIVFRLIVESTQEALLPGQGVENYEILDVASRLLLATGGGLLLGIIWQSLAERTRQVGVVHTMERLAYHQGRLPIRNALAQFFGAGLSIICGHSVGREGPSVHLGAASGSVLGHWLHLPNNSNRTLVGCGVAGAIAASFNTPLAGVIFAMEVVMVEYTLVSFAPVILSAVIATTLTQAVFGGTPVFSIPDMQLGSLLELPYVVLMGCLIGVTAAVFIRVLSSTTTRTSSWPVWLRFTLGGLLVGLIAIPFPQVMGIGYDTVDQALLGQLGLAALVMLTVAKLMASALCLGLGIPGGLIGPTLVIGATAGGAMGILAFIWQPGDISSPAFYALIGMGTMMGATLQAPLAALTAMLELTSNPHIILPGMLALISGCLVSREIFGYDSVFQVLLRARGLDYRDSPLTRTLRGIGVASVMERDIETLPVLVEREKALAALDRGPTWIVLTEDNTPVSMMPAADLAHALSEDEKPETLDLYEIPAERQQLAAVDFRSTLLEAQELLDDSDIEALYVKRTTVPGTDRLYGIITRDIINQSYTTRN